MPRFKPERWLQEIAAEMLADERFARLFALFDDQPPVASRAREPRHRRARRLPGPLLIALTLLVSAAVPAFLVTAQVTRIPAFTMGIVLIVPAFLLFGRCCQGQRIALLPRLSPAG